MIEPIILGVLAGVRLVAGANSEYALDVKTYSVHATVQLLVWLTAHQC